MTDVVIGSPDQVTVTALVDPTVTVAVPAPTPVTIQTPIGTASVVSVQPTTSVDVTYAPASIVPVSVTTTPSPVSITSTVALGADGIKDAFETVSKNLKSYGATFAYGGGGDLSSITYDLGFGLTIVKTFNYSGSDISSIVLSGDTPSGIDLTKTFSYSGGDISSVAYS